MYFYNMHIYRMFKLYLFYNDYETSYTTFINHARWHRCLRSDGLRVGGNRSFPEETHLPDLVTTWPSHIPTPGIETGSQWWEASAFTLCQLDSEDPSSITYIYILTELFSNHSPCICRWANIIDSYRYMYTCFLTSRCVNIL